MPLRCLRWWLRGCLLWQPDEGRLKLVPLAQAVGVHEATFRWGKSRTWLRPSKVWIEPRHEQGLALFPPMPEVSALWTQAA
jgi:hypothetical protein